MHIFFNSLFILNVRVLTRTLLLCLVGIYLAFTSTYLLAETMISPLKFERVSTKEGLSQSFVYDMVQDKHGFIWIATQDGLNRYDGNDFVHYRNNILDPRSISNNFIRKIYIDINDNLWIGTQNGLSKYNPATDDFENYFHDSENNTSLQDNIIWNVYQDTNGTLWVATEQSLHRYNIQDNDFTRIRIRGTEENLQEAKTIFLDDNNNYWFGTYDNGIYLVDKSLSSVVSLKTQNKWHISIPATTLSDIKVIDDNYWLATDIGVYVLDKGYHLIKHFTSSTKESSLSSNNVKTILQINDSQVWVGTIEGINIINLHDDSVEYHKKNEDDYSLSDNKVYKLLKDSSGKIWIGTGEGVSIFNPVSLSFKHHLFKSKLASQNIYAFAELPDGTILFAKEGDGLYKITPSEIVAKLPIAIDSSIEKIIVGTNRFIYLINHEDQLYQYDINTNSIHEHKRWLQESNYSIYSQFFYIKDKIWFFDNNGILANYSPETQAFEKFPLKDRIKITSLQIENQNSFWLSNSENQVLSFNPQDGKFSIVANIKNNNFLISKAKTIAVSDNWLWLGSNEQGLMLISRTTKQSWVFNEKNGLKNNFINDIFIDENQNAWFSTNRGISTISPTAKKIKNFSAEFGVSNNEYLIGSALNSKNGQAMFGGLNGYHSFEPSDVLAISQKINTPIFTNLLVANKKISILDTADSKQNFSLSKQLNELKTLTLKYFQSPFSIEFVSPNAKLSNQLGYRYRLVGLEKDWIETDVNNRRATYTNLDAGNYVFEVQVVDLLSSTPSRTNSLNITIMPPWWLSKTAIIIYSLIILLITIYVVQQMRHKRLYHLQIKLSEERLKLSLWGSGDEMWDWNIEIGKIYRSNIWGILEFPQDGKRNVGANETNIHHQDIPRVREALSKHFAQETDHFEATYRVKDKDNKWIWVLDRGKIVERNEKDTPIRMTGTLKDISQIKHAEGRLKLFAKCIENISDAVVIYDRQFIIVDVNKAFLRITKNNKTQMLGKSLTFSQYPEAFAQNVKKHLITKGGWHGEIENRHDNGQLYHTDLNIDLIRDDNNNISHFVGVFSDITERKANEVELRKLANSDTLTGLPNRSYFQANQHRLVNNKTPHALLVFDLDNFKKINDSMGHGVGDALLCKVAQRILSLSRKQDTVYRLGGDEFSIIVENTNDIHTITTIAKDILRTIALPLKLKNQEMVLYSSIGIVLYPEDGINPQELLKNADTAMYHAKDSGGNKYQFFSDSMNKKAVKRIQIENLIRHGLKEDSFSVFYQPKIEISTGKVAAMEALVRFQTPSKGVISPIVFIPVSEETGQIIDIGEIVLRKSCIATKKWVDAGLFEGRVAVNLSAVQFTQPNLVGMIADILKESQLPAKHLELEITEGTVMNSPQKAIDTMLQIRAMGIHLSLDDFGTGYSSLAYLKKFPLNTLKIDKAFVDDIETSEQGRNMVATIVTIAHNLGLQVVAEGVETTNQLSFLAGLKCEQLQGYLYSKPLPEKDFQTYLLSHQIADKSTLFNKS